jgi:S-(hydroxymethyl)glutathione dehydrogenase/alcohol dehydrogenase
MRAALLEASGEPLVVVNDVDIDDPGPGEVLVRVAHCGVCHSDYSNVNGTFPPPGPIVLGHEAAGFVESVGAGVSHIVVGDKVVLSPIAVCGRCYSCTRGEYGTCVNAAAITTGTFVGGATGLHRSGGTVYRGLGVGGFAEYALVDAAAAIKVPDDTPLDIACVIGCAVQTGVGAVFNAARMEPGATVLVMGLGGIGIAIVQGARIAGASRIIVSDPIEERRAAAAHFGATDVLDPGTTDVVAAAHALTGVGVDYAFDAVGHRALVEAGMWACRSGGTTVIVGAAPIDHVVSVPAVLFMVSERKLIGTLLGGCNGHREIPRLIGLWRAGRLDLEGMVTARRPLAEVNDAFADMAAGRGLRTVLDIAG